eukprot:gene2630-3267_t
MSNTTTNNFNNTECNNTRVYSKAKNRQIVKVKIPVIDENKKFDLEGLLSYIPSVDNLNFNNNESSSSSTTTTPPFSSISPLSDIGIVITHPHPMLGGSYNNNVVLSVLKHLTDYLHVPTLCFNFRGVGESQGSGSWRGGNERMDTIAAVKYLLNNNVLEYKPKKIILVGYSYGSVISSSIADQVDEVVGFVAISYPFGPLTLMLLGHLLDPAINSTKPKLFVIGDDDTFTGVSKFKSRVSEMKGIVKHKIFPGVGHFYVGQEKLLVREITNWIVEFVNGN